MSNFTTWRSLVDGEEISAIPDALEYWAIQPIDGLSTNDDVSAWPWERPEEEPDISFPDEPSYDEELVGGTPGIDFDGSSNYGDLGGLSSFFSAISDPVEPHAVIYSGHFPTGAGSEMLLGLNPNDPNTHFYLDHGRAIASSGGIGYELRDEDRNQMTVTSNDTYDDGEAHFIIVNVTGNTGQDIDIYVDDMDNPIGVSVDNDDTVTDKLNPDDDPVFLNALNNDGSPEGYSDVGVATVGFATDSLSGDERKSLKDEELWT